MRCLCALAPLERSPSTIHAHNMNSFQQHQLFLYRYERWTNQPNNWLYTLYVGILDCFVYLYCCTLDLPILYPDLRSTASRATAARSLIASIDWPQWVCRAPSSRCSARMNLVTPEPRLRFRCRPPPNLRYDSVEQVSIDQRSTLVKWDTMASNDNEKKQLSHSKTSILRSHYKSRYGHQTWSCGNPCATDMSNTWCTCLDCVV